MTKRPFLKISSFLGCSGGFVRICSMDLQSGENFVSSPAFAIGRNMALLDKYEVNREKVHDMVEKPNVVFDSFPWKI